MATVDERIVGMKFDNQEFEKRVSTTLGTLEKLKEKLDFKGVKQGLGDLSSVANGVRLDGLAAGVDNLSSRFQGLRAIATGALLEIGSRVIDLGQTLVQNITRGATEGFAEYETQINAIQTILANTSSKGTTLEQVNAALDELNAYSDKTIYNFTEMTRNIGTFTAAGVALDTSVTAIKGIANLAAVSGSNSQQAATAMYQLSQAISTGTVRLMDWNSVVNAGMGGEVFQEALKATARAHGIAVDDMIAKQGSFRESLSEGWLTSTVLLDTLAKFTGDLTREQIMSMGYTAEQAEEIFNLGQMANDAATKVKTFTQLMQTLAEATSSGWAQSWRIIIGDFEEARTFYTEVSDTIGALIGQSADARNAQLKIWADGGGREAIIQGLRNAFTALMKVITPIQEAFREVFPPSLGKTLLTLSFWFRDFTAGLIISDNAAANLKMVAKALFSVLKFGVDVIWGVVRVGAQFLKIIWDLVSGVLAFIGPILSFVRSLLPVSENANKATWSISSLFDIIVAFQKFIDSKLVNALKAGRDGFDNWLKSGGPKQALLDIINALVAFGQAVASVYNILFHADYTKNPLFSEDSGFADFLFKTRDAFIAIGKAIGDFFKNVGKAFKNFGKSVNEGMSNGFADIDWNIVLAGLNTGLVAAIVVGILKLIKSITNVFGGVKAGIIDGISDALGGLTDILKSMSLKIKAEALLKIAIAIGILALSLLVLSTIEPERLISATAGLATSFGMLLGAMAILDKILQGKSFFKLPLIAFSLGLLAQALLVLSVSVRILGTMSWEQLAKGMSAIAILLGGLVAAAVVFSKFQNQILSAAIGMMAMAAALGMLIVPILALAFIPYANLIQGMLATTLMLSGLVVAALLFSKLKNQIALAAVGMIAMAQALNMLIVPILALAFLPMANLIQGMAAVAIMLGVLAAAGILFSTLKNQMAIASIALIGMAFALNLLVAPIVALGLISGNTLAQGLIGLAIALGVLIAAAALLSLIGPMVIVGALGLIILASAMLVMALAIAALAAMPMNFLMQGLLNLGIALGILALTSVVLIPFIPALLLLGIALGALGIGMLVITVSLAIFVAALVALTPALALAAAGLLAFAALTPKLMESVPAFLAIGAGLLVFGLGAAVAGAGVIILAAGLLLLGVALMLLGLFGAAGAAGLTAFVNAIVALFGQSLVLLAMAGVFAVLGAAVLVLGAGLLVLGAGLLLVGISMAIFTAIGSAGAIALQNIINTLLGFMGSLPALLVLSVALLALGVAITLVGTGLIVLGVGALVAAGGLALLMLVGQTASQALIKLGVAVMFLLPLVPAMLAVSLAFIALGAALTVFSIGAMVAAVALLLLGPAVMLLGLGMQILGTALRVMAKVGESGAAGLSAFIASLDGLIWQVPALLAIAAAFLAMGAGLLVLGAGLLLVGAGALLATAGLKALALINTMVTLSLAKLLLAITAFTPANALLLAIAVSATALTVAFAALALSALASALGLSAIVAQLTAINTAANAGSIRLNLMMKTVAMNLPTFNTSLEMAATKYKLFVALILAMSGDLESGLRASTPKTVSASKILANVLVTTLLAALIASRSNMYNSGYDIGDQVIQGLRQGLQNGSSSVEYIARQVALNILAAQKKALGINSPSKESYDFGMFMDMGLGDGMMDYSKYSEKAATKVGNNSVEALRESIRNIGDAFYTEMDLTPTITPVLDLSALKRGSAEMSRTISTNGISLSSAYGELDALATARQIEATEAIESGESGSSETTVVFNQTNNSPKAISSAETYRNTQSLISKAKDRLVKKDD